MKKGIGRSHSKIILSGEHAVVYSKPAISIPFFSCRVLVEVWENEIDEIKSSIFNGDIYNRLEFEAISSLVKELKSKFRLPNLSYNITSSIPVSSGMGSSAAVAAAIIEAVYDFLDLELSNREHFEWTQFSERIAHGNPSGIDALTTIHNKAWLFQKEKEALEFNPKLDAYLVVGQTGKIGNTKEAVSMVRLLVNNDGKMPLIDEIGTLVMEAYNAYINQDIEILSRSLNKNQVLLKELKVSSKEIDEMVNLALTSGANASKLTGGGRGGCTIALTSSSDVAEIIKKRWKEYSNKQAWILYLGEELK